MRRADHAGIFILIAGTYTPVGLISLHGSLRWVVLATVWAGALAATISKFCWVAAPKWLSAAVGIMLGWVGVIAAGFYLLGQGWTAVRRRAPTFRLRSAPVAAP